MSISVADYGSAFWLGMLVGINTVPAQYWVALLINDADEGYDGTVLAAVEPVLTDELLVATGYLRRPYGVGAGSWSSTEGGFTTNTIAISYPVPTADWGIVLGWALCTSSVAGELFAFGEFDNPQYVAAGNALIIPAGGLTLTMTGPTNTIVV